MSSAIFALPNAAKRQAPASPGSKPLREPKNIVICCDGTGNEFVAGAGREVSNSNVVKLYTTLSIEAEQAAYYHPGVGTLGDPRARTWLGKKWSVVSGLAFAAGFKNNVLDAYEFLMETYADGDQVYLFGFSRGAYTVRALAGLLDGYGLLCPGNEGHMSYAWNSYARQHKNRKQNKAETNRCFKETFSRRTFRIHFLGIWDTVSSVGWAYTPLRLFSIAQNPTVRHGRHALSIDERRCFFRNNVWEPATAAQLAAVASERDPEPQQDLLQVWFAGVHSDVGGSYPQAASGLANVALNWLLEEAEAVGLRTKEHMRQVVLGQPVTAAIPDEAEERRVKELQELYASPESAEVHHSLRRGWWLLELLPHRYFDKDSGGEKWRTPLGVRRRLPSGVVRMYAGGLQEEVAYLHHSAVELMAAGAYQPPNVVGGLKSLVPVTRENGGQPALYRYRPAHDPRPWWNRRLARWSIMLGVSAAELALLWLMLWVVWHGLLLVLRHLALG